MPSQILVVGATGKQGSQVLKHLLLAGHPASAITALTRNPASAAAEKIKSKGVNVVQGSLSNVESLKQALTGKDAAFLVTTAIIEKGEIDEDHQGQNFLDAAKAVSLPYLVFTSIASASQNTGVPHFESKHRIEESLKSSGLNWSIIRPVAFYDNWPKSASFAQGMALGMFDAALKGKPLQLIAVKDIGHFGAQALLHPETYGSKTTEIAGDELTMEQARAVYARVFGSAKKYWAPAFALRALPFDLRVMFYWFESTGFAVSIPQVKAQHPGLLSLEDWLRAKEDDE